MTAPVLSVVVPTFQRADRLPRLVEALARQEIDVPFEVVVVDDGSADETSTVLDRLAAEAPFPLRPIHLEQNAGPAAGRNVGWREATADLIVFTDDDCRPTPTWLSSLHAAFADADVVQGRTLPDPEHEANWGPFSRTVEVTSENGFYETCNIGYRRPLLADLGGFDDGFRLIGDDTDLGWRAREAGARITFVDDAVVYHEVSPSSYRAHLRLMRRWADVPLTVRRHPRLRTEVYYSRWFWRSSHPKALAALAGMAIALAPAGASSRPLDRVGRLAAAWWLVWPYFRFRTRVAPLRCGPRRRLALLPAVWLRDVLEVGALVRASVRHRTLIL